jgi:hypothetical protein
MNDKDKDKPITTAWELAQAVLAGRTEAVERLLRERRPGLVGIGLENYQEPQTRLTLTAPPETMAFILWRLVAGPELSEVHADKPDSLGSTYGK